MPNLNQYLLSEPNFFVPLCEQLEKLIKGEISSLNEDILKMLTYSSWQSRNFSWTDQIFHGHWRRLLKNKEEYGWSYSLLDQCARYYFVDDVRRIVIKNDKFGPWQNWLANQSGFPSIALQMSKQLDGSLINDIHQLSNFTKNSIGRRGIISPYNKKVEDYILNEGLHESHLHLNGTTLFEQLWHETLLTPNELVKQMTDTFYNNDKVKLLYATYPFVDHPKKLLNILLLARRLRETILVWLNVKCKNNNFEKYNDVVRKLLKHLISHENEESNNYIEEKKRFGNIEPYWSHVEELNWQIQLLYKIKREPVSSRSLIDTCYLLYLQCMNCFQHFFVQRVDQYGFDQFQKFADNDSRSQIEQSYMARFYQLHGPRITDRPDLVTLEGRFAPKRTSEKNVELVRRILSGYLEYAGGYKSFELSTDLDKLATEVLKYKRPSLRLVAHFIKLPWNSNDGGYYFQARREDLQVQAYLLCSMLENYPRLRSIITGIDAAANELEAPPEIFAPIYRYCKHKGIKNFTFHTGEDFEHLLSGIRATFDAIQFLDLQNGDRIGHGTAIGIEPSLWLESMPDVVYLRRSEWLNNLLFLRKIALENLNSQINIGRIETEIRQLSLDIFNEIIPIEDLQKAWQHRGLHPQVIIDALNLDTMNILGHIGFLSKEYELVKEIEIRVLKLLKRQTCEYEILKNNEVEIEIEIKQFSSDIFIEVQQYVQRYIVKRNVVVETLPTSNVRISHYNKIEQHHIFRWLQIPERTVAGDSKMLITLGSDDPGIFATDTRNEFYHLFTVLMEKFKYSETEALNILRPINENGRIYRFDGPLSPSSMNKNAGLAET